MVDKANKFFTTRQNLELGKKKSIVTTINRSLPIFDLRKTGKALAGGMGLGYVHVTCACFN